MTGVAARLGAMLAAAATLAAGCGGKAARSDDLLRRAQAGRLAEALQADAEAVADEARRDRLTRGLQHIRDTLDAGPNGTVTSAAGSAPPPGSCPQAMFEPKAISIGFFTQSKRFGSKAKQNGLEVRVQPLDQFGDPTKALGRFHIEAFAYRQHTTEPRGERLGHWAIEVLDAAHNRTYYDPIDRSYVFPVLWPAKVTPGRRVIVQATFSPWADTEGGRPQRLFAQRVITIGG